MLHRLELVQRVLAERGLDLTIEQHRFSGPRPATPQSYGDKDGEPLRILEFGSLSAPIFDYLEKKA
jgi:hypothetical protein